MSLSSIPTHVAIIMDGNGRWAKNRGKPRTFGHLQGVETLNNIVSHAQNLGIKFLTLYAFSTENWNRSHSEVSFLMDLFSKKLNEYISDDKNNKLKINIIGSRSRLSGKILRLSEDLTEKTKLNSGMTLNVAFNYGGRSEIIDASRKIAYKYKKGIIKNLDDITEEKFGKFLYTHDQPDVDLLIRTGGEFRVSNFLLWQISYSELFFTKTLWPDFSNDDFDKAISEFNLRVRKFGSIFYK